MTLQTKILQLKLDAALAVRHAQGWQRLIDTYGEDQATAFYASLGLNHLPAKSFDYDGLQLSREPKEHEKLAVKGIAQAQESSKVAIGNILLGLRAELITDGFDSIARLSPSTYHELVLDPPVQFSVNLRDQLIQVHRQGRLLVISELGMKAATADDDNFDELDDLVDLTLSRVTNDTQARIIAAAAEYALLGQSGDTLLGSIQTTINTGSVSYIDRTAGGLSNRVVGIGRRDEMVERNDEIERYEYSALLDVNTCGPCAELDATEAANMDDLPEVPLADCEGGSQCRCFIVAVAV